MNYMHMSNKAVAFWRAVGVAVLFALLNSVSHNIGASGIVSSSVATFIVGIIGVIESVMSKGDTKAFLGSVNID